MRVSNNNIIFDSGEKIIGNVIDANSYSIPSHKNFIINGAMDIWQTGTTFSALTSGSTHIVDMFRYGQSNDGSMDVSQSTNVPTVANEATFQPNYSIKLQPHAVDTTIDASQYSQVLFILEGYNYRRLKDKTVTLSFWVSSNKTGTYCSALRNGVNDRAYVSEYTINQSNTWEKKSVTVTLDQTGGTENYTNGKGLQVSWTFCSGSTYQTSANVWQSANYLATSNQVNFMDNVANTFYLAMVQFELGSVATDFEYRSIDQELVMCQRYFEKSYNLEDSPGSIIADGIHELRTAVATTLITGSGPKFMVLKRITPIIVFYSSATGASGKIRNFSGTPADVSVSSYVCGASGIGTLTTKTIGC